MSDLATWYYVGSFGQLGPLTKEQLEELVEGGVIEKQTYIWRPGMNDWLPAYSVPEMTAAFLAVEPFASPPPTPMAQIPPLQPHGSPVNTTSPGSYPPAAFSAPASNSANYPRPTFGYAMPANIARSDKSRTLSGILQLLIPGAGRIYLGYAALGVIQLITAIMTCGVLHVWSIVDGILLLSGQVRLDGYGRALED